MDLTTITSWLKTIGRATLNQNGADTQRTNGVNGMTKLEFQAESVKALPAVGGALYSSLTMNELVALATLFYIVLQAAYLIWKWRREAKGL